MASARRLFYEGVIYRFKFLMLATLLCAAMTVIGFILGQVSEGKWKWDEDIDLEYTSAFFTGVYGMWNVYILALLCLYSPSHKRWPSENGDNSHFHPIISLLNRILLELYTLQKALGKPTKKLNSLRCPPNPANCLRSLPS
jgi:hypothetical protein